jgi:ribose 5-phosphate isomerase B
MARRHNDANVVALSGARLKPELADAIVRTFLRTGFEGGRHARRIGQIADLERDRRSVVPSESAAATGA